MIRQIKKQASVFVAIIVLLVLALGIGGYILSNQRFYLPKEVPVLGTDFYRVKAEFQTGQAVVPGQGQTVNIAGVSVGDVGKVTLERGRAVIQMNIRAKYRPIYKNASVLLRPKTGLKDMYLSLDPGTKEAGALEEGGRVRVANTLPDVNPDEVLAQLDRDTRDYLRILLNAGGTAFDDEAAGNTNSAQTASQDLREAFKRFEPTARDGKKITDLLAERRNNTKRVIHNFQLLMNELGDKDKQLAALVDSANANFEAFAQEESSLREALNEFPPALSQTASTLRKVETFAGELGPALGGLRPFARNLAPALRSTRPFLRETTPIIREQIRPFARDVQPVVRDLRSATNDLAVVTPRLTRTFGVLNKLFNELAYDPPGGSESFLFWSAWAAHNGILAFNSQDAHGPLLRGTVLVSCANRLTLRSIVASNEQLGLLTRLLNLPPEEKVCPENGPVPPTAPTTPAPTASGASADPGKATPSEERQGAAR